MIKRYSRNEVSNLWEDENKFSIYLKVEILVAQAWSKLGVIPESDIKLLWQKAKFNLTRIYQLEQETKHDIVAFTRSVSESLGNEKKWIHYGLTSTDVVDTANGYLFKQVNLILQNDLEIFIKVLKDQAIKYKNTPCIGRTHGVHADITSFGLKWALWYAEMQRNLTRFKAIRNEVEVGKISGAVGNFANTPPFVQDYVCEKLGINSAKISTQTLQRDRHANYLAILALIAASLEKISVEIRHLQRTEVRELEEQFFSGQKGSSAMPHKRNPISSENISGCARLMRGYMVSIYENVALWHERDISHSAVERIVLPDATILLDYMLNRYVRVLENLTIFPDRMLHNIELTNGVVFAQRIMTALIDKGLEREIAYDIIQPIAIQCWQNKLNFKEQLLKSDKVLTYFSNQEITDLFDLKYFLRNVSEIFNRVGI